MSWILDNVVDNVIYALGPVLVMVALAIMGGLSYAFFTVTLPMIAPSGPASVNWVMHMGTFCFILMNVMHNYFLCVTTSNKGPSFDRVVRELAEASDFSYPETSEETAAFLAQFEHKIADRRRQRQLQQNTITYSWMLLGPQEWGFCYRSNQAKPPRAHFDHVTNTLVLNMDHFCPWMFNTVGYFNYRYFCNFLLFVFIGMFYGATITYTPFQNLSSKLFKEQIKISRTNNLSTVQRIFPLVPTPPEKTAIALTFMLCLSIGVAVLFLLLFHLYLILTAQTTVEFHGNWANKKRARKRGTSWINPYDLGSKANWTQIYGTSHPLRAMLPSSREPEFLPIPINGELIRRHAKIGNNTIRETTSFNDNLPFNV